MTTFKCEKCDETDHIEHYHIDSGENTYDADLCPTHAREEGFCWGCGAFVLGIDGDEHSLRTNGFCMDCWDEIRAEAGEFDEDNEYGDEYSFDDIQDLPGEVHDDETP